MTSEKHKSNYNTEIQIPGKTFLFGEYAILVEGACLGIGTSPCFTFDKNSTVDMAVHENSPAGRFILKHKIDSFALNLSNPYKVGGFGASTAEFLYFYLNSNLDKNIQTCVECYRDLYQGSSEQPSGMDVVTQLMGGLSLIDIHHQQIRHKYIDWPFLDIDFVICSTGLKVQTHQHLAELDRKKCFDLVGPSHELYDLVQKPQVDPFFIALNEWVNRLVKLNLIHSEILDLKKQLDRVFKDQLSFFESKPCGALGADVIILFFNKNEKQKFTNLFKSWLGNRLKIQADLSQISYGPLA